MNNMNMLTPGDFMKLLLSALISISFNSALAEQTQYKTVTGIFIHEKDCAETGYALATKKDGIICLGFYSDHLTEKDLVLGVRYSLGGYQTEDGFFATEFSH